MKLHVFSLSLAVCLSAHAWGSSLPGNPLCEAEAGAAGRVMISFLSQSLDEEPALLDPVSQLANGEGWFNPLPEKGLTYKNIFHRKGVARAMKLVREEEIPGVRTALREMLAKRSGQEQEVAIAREQTREVFAPRMLDPFVFEPGRDIEILESKQGFWHDRPVMIAACAMSTAGFRINKLLFFDPFNPDKESRTREIPKTPDKNPGLGFFKRAGKTYVGAFKDRLLWDLDAWKQISFADLGLEKMKYWDGPFREALHGVFVVNIAAKDFLWVWRNDKVYAYDLGVENPEPQWTTMGEFEFLRNKSVGGKDFLIATMKHGDVVVRDLTDGTLDFKYVNKEGNVGVEDSSLVARGGKVYLVLRESRNWQNIEFRRVDLGTGDEETKFLIKGSNAELELFAETVAPKAIVSTGREHFVIDPQTMKEETVEKFGANEWLFEWNHSPYVVTNGKIFEMATRSQVAVVPTPSNLAPKSVSPFAYGGRHYLFISYKNGLPTVMQLTEAYP